MQDYYSVPLVLIPLADSTVDKLSQVWVLGCMSSLNTGSKGFVTSACGIMSLPEAFRSPAKDEGAFLLGKRPRLPHLCSHKTSHHQVLLVASLPCHAVQGPSADPALASIMLAVPQSFLGKLAELSFHFTFMQMQVPKGISVCSPP